MFTSRMATSATVTNGVSGNLNLYAASVLVLSSVFQDDATTLNPMWRLVCK